MISFREKKNKNSKETVINLAKENGVTITGKSDNKPAIIFYLSWLAGLIAAFMLSAFIVGNFLLVYVVNIGFVVFYIVKFHLLKK